MGGAVEWRIRLRMAYGGQGGGVLGEGDEGFEAFADDVNVWQAGFVWQDFPGGIEERGGSACGC